MANSTPFDLAQFAALTVAMATGCTGPTRAFVDDSTGGTTSGDGGTGGTAGSGGEAGQGSGGGGSGGGGTGGTGGSGGGDPWVATTTDCTDVDDVSIDRPTSVGFNYCIEGHEVTREEYQVFLDTLPTVDDNVGPACSWNTVFDPTHDPQGECVNVASNYLYSTNAQLPVTCVDWCDAAAYCQSVGKHLCSGMEGSPNAVGSATASDVDTDQWYRACASVAGYYYPYGSTYEGNYCLDNFSAPTVVRSLADNFNECKHVSLPIYEMSGNASEWVAGCTGTAGGSDVCQVRGGSFKDGVTSTRCDYLNTTFPRDTLREDVGFRCCKG